MADLPIRSSGVPIIGQDKIVMCVKCGAKGTRDQLENHECKTPLMYSNLCVACYLIDKKVGASMIYKGSSICEECFKGNMSLPEEPNDKV